MPGVLDLDLMQLVRRDHKLDSYSLNNVSKKFLGGETKVDLPAYKIFEKFRGSASDRADIARYAVQDVLLPLKLFRRLHLYDTLSQMSIATCVPIDFLLSRGQQVRADFWHRICAITICAITHANLSTPTRSRSSRSF